MEFRIADTFTESLSKLTGQEKSRKNNGFDLQTNPASPACGFTGLIIAAIRTSGQSAQA